MQSGLLGMAENSQEAISAARANLSPRQRELETLERYAEGKQYEGLPDWFDDSVPLWNRAPCIVYTQTKTAILSNIDLVFGERLFPVITSNPGENDEGAGGLDEDQSKKVDRAIVALFTKVRFRSVSRQALKHAQSAKSVAVVAGARNGKAFLELVRSRWCEPTFDQHGAVEKLEIRYPYIDWLKQPDGKWKLEAKLYRRVIDAESDTTYIPLTADKSGKDPLESEWSPDKAKTVKHDLGFCPVHWYPHMVDCSTVADYDGHAIHEDCLDEIRGLDFALSQRHRAALFCGDPQTIETGVEPGSNPSGQVGQASGVPSTMAGGAANGANPVTGNFGRPRTSARIKSPGIAWQYENADAKVSYLALPEGGLKALDEHAADLRNKIAEDLAVVILDPQNAKFTAAMSGAAVVQIRATQFNRCDAIRSDVEDGWLLPVTKLLIRVALATDVKIKAMEPVREILAEYAADDAEAPELFVRWPSSYVAPDATENNMTVTMTVAAKKAGLITTRMGLERIAPIFGVDNIDQAVEALQVEKDEAEAKLHQAMTAMGAGANNGEGGSEGGNADQAGNRGRRGTPAAQETGNAVA